MVGARQKGVRLRGNFQMPWDLINERASGKKLFTHPVRCCTFKSLSEGGTRKRSEWMRQTQCWFSTLMSTQLLDCLNEAFPRAAITADDFIKRQKFSAPWRLMHRNYIAGRTLRIRDVIPWRSRQTSFCQLSPLTPFAAKILREKCLRLSCNRIICSLPLTFHKVFSPRT